MCIQCSYIGLQDLDKIRSCRSVGVNVCAAFAACPQESQGLPDNLENI